MSDPASFKYDDTFTPAKARRKRKNKQHYERRSPLELYEIASQQLLSDDGGKWLKGFERACVQPFLAVVV